MHRSNRNIPFKFTLILLELNFNVCVINPLFVNAFTKSITIRKLKQIVRMHIYYFSICKREIVVHLGYQSLVI